jgi:hypothetical protein
VSFAIAARPPAPVKILVELKAGNQLNVKQLSVNSGP